MSNGLRSTTSSSAPARPGCVVARRLVDAGARVALVEAGGFGRRPTDHDARSACSSCGRASSDYDFATEPQEHAEGVVMQLPRGKVLGGSSALNGMIYVRGAAAGLRRLGLQRRSRAGRTRTCCRFFKKSEDFEGGASGYHGVGGPLRVSINHEPNPLTPSLLAAAAEAGVPLNEDPNGPEILGAGMAHLERQGRRPRHLLDGLRRSDRGEPAPHGLHERPSDAPALRRKALHRCGRSRPRTASESCTRAPTWSSRPGPISRHSSCSSAASATRADLDRVGVTPHHHLPGVGENLHDHFLVPLVYEATEPIAPHRANVMEAHFFAKSDEGMTAPDLQPLMVAIPIPVRGRELTEQAFTMLAGVIRPLSRGHVRLKSADPIEPPAIDFRYLSEEQDVVAIEAAISALSQDRRATGARCCARRRARPGRRGNGRRAPAVHRRAATHLPPPRRHVPDGTGLARRRRPETSSPRAREPSRCRRVDHACRAVGEHPRALCDGRRDGPPTSFSATDREVDHVIRDEQFEAGVALPTEHVRGTGDRRPDRQRDRARRQASGVRDPPVLW